MSNFSAYKNGGVLWDTYKNPLRSEDRGLVSRGDIWETVEFGGGNRLEVIADFI